MALMKTKSLDTILAGALVLVVVSALAHTWQQTDPVFSSYGALGMSADGRILYAVPSASHPIISEDFGKTWVVQTNIPPGPGAALGGVAISADGSKIFASLATNGSAQSSVYLSPDHGTTWTQTAFPSPASFHHLACSADGMKVIAAVANSGIFYSTNGGTNSYLSSAPSPGWLSVASSADGNRMAAGYSLGMVYFSQDFGATWNPANLSVQNLHSVCVSGDGKWVGAAGANDSFISNDLGVSWTSNHLGGQTIACSALGTCWLITGAQIYTSTNSGVTWQTNLNSAPLWYAGAVSADGCEMAVNGYGQGTYMGRLTPSPQLNIQPSDTNMSVSWLIPSTNFVLQQNADLANPIWTPVLIEPTLNFTNLNQQVTLPGNGSNSFFRLNAQ